MVWPLSRAVNVEREIARANDPQIRFFKVKLEDPVPHQPESDIGGTWQVCSPQSATEFSAVSFFLHRKFDEYGICPLA